MMSKRITLQSATFDVDFSNFFASFSEECSDGAIRTDSLGLIGPLQTLTSSYSLFSPAFSSRFVDTIAKYTGQRVALSVEKTNLPEDVKYYLGYDISTTSLDVICVTCVLKGDLFDLVMAFVPAVCSGLVNQPDLNFSSILAKFAHQLLKTPVLAQVFSTKESSSGVFLDLIQFSVDAYNNAVATSSTDKRQAQDCFTWLRLVLNFLDSEAEKFSCAATGFAFRVLSHAGSSDVHVPVEYIFSSKTWDRACFYLVTVKNIHSLVLETDSPAQCCFVSMGQPLSPVAERINIDSRCATPVIDERDIPSVENPLMKLLTELKASSTVEEPPKQHIDNGCYWLNEGTSQSTEIPFPVEVASNDLIEAIIEEQTRPMAPLSPIATPVLQREEEHNYELTATKKRKKKRKKNSEGKDSARKRARCEEHPPERHPEQVDDVDADHAPQTVLPDPPTPAQREEGEKDNHEIVKEKKGKKKKKTKHLVDNDGLGYTHQVSFGENRSMPNDPDVSDVEVNPPERRALLLAAAANVEDDPQSLGLFHQRLQRRVNLSSLTLPERNLASFLDYIFTHLATPFKNNPRQHQLFENFFTWGFDLFVDVCVEKINQRQVFSRVNEYAKRLLRADVLTHRRQLHLAELEVGKNIRKSLSDARRLVTSFCDTAERFVERVEDDLKYTRPDTSAFEKEVLKLRRESVNLYTPIVRAERWFSGEGEGECFGCAERKCQFKQNDRTLGKELFRSGLPSEIQYIFPQTEEELRRAQEKIFQKNSSHSSCEDNLPSTSQGVRKPTRPAKVPTTGGKHQQSKTKRTN